MIADIIFEKFVSSQDFQKLSPKKIKFWEFLRYTGAAGNLTEWKPKKEIIWKKEQGGNLIWPKSSINFIGGFCWPALFAYKESIID